MKFALFKFICLLDYQGCKLELELNSKNLDRFAELNLELEIQQILFLNSNKTVQVY